MQLDLSEPSLKPDLAVTITFDGGSLGNPGAGYGSYAIAGLDREPIFTRLNFSESGQIVTNNQAEYRTLIKALEDVSNRVGTNAQRTALTVQGDSKLVIEQVAGRWKVKNAELKSLVMRAQALVTQFGKVTLVWHPRSKSVDILGH